MNILINASLAGTLNSSKSSVPLLSVSCSSIYFISSCSYVTTKLITATRLF